MKARDTQHPRGQPPENTAARHGGCQKRQSAGLADSFPSWSLHELGEAGLPSHPKPGPRGTTRHHSQQSEVTRPSPGQSPREKARRAAVREDKPDVWGGEGGGGCPPKAITGAGHRQALKPAAMPEAGPGPRDHDDLLDNQKVNWTQPMFRFRKRGAWVLLLFFGTDSSLTFNIYTVKHTR